MIRVSNRKYRLFLDHIDCDYPGVGDLAPVSPDTQAVAV